MFFPRLQKSFSPQPLPTSHLPPLRSVLKRYFSLDLWISSVSACCTWKDSWVSNHLVYFSGGDLDAASKSIMGIAMNDNDENVHLLVVVRIFFKLIFACHNDTNKNVRYIKKAWKGGLYLVWSFSHILYLPNANMLNTFHALKFLIFLGLL